jgi:hypothetical protein
MTGTMAKKVRFPLIFRRADGSYYSYYNTGFEPGGFFALLNINSKGCRVVQ